jgi:hypothetical protein
MVVICSEVGRVDVRGVFGISYDPGTWIQSLCVWAEIIGMAISPWQLVTFTLKRWTLFSIALCDVSSVLIPFSPNIEAALCIRTPLLHRWGIAFINCALGGVLQRSIALTVRR